MYCFMQRMAFFIIKRQKESIKFYFCVDKQYYTAYNIVIKAILLYYRIL